MMEKLSSEELEQRFADVAENLKVIRENMAEAAVQSGRKPESITLLAATKTVPVEVINRSIELGVDHIGENRVQELCDKLQNTTAIFSAGASSILLAIFRSIR